MAQPHKFVFAMTTLRLEQLCNMLILLLYFLLPVSKYYLYSKARTALEYVDSAVVLPSSSFKILFILHDDATKPVQSNGENPFKITIIV